MIEISVAELLKVTGGRFLEDKLTPKHRIQGVSIDSRTLKKGNLFISIRGRNQDGHEFIPQAFKAGASLAIVEKKRAKNLGQKDLPMIVVEDSGEALYELALWYRKQFALPAVAITGTNGKTTTKEMVAEVLSKKHTVLRSPKSYNNLIGIPLTLFEITPETRILVLELGMNSPGEISRLTNLVKPDWGVITNIGPAHLESMKSISNIAKAKFELLDNMGDDKTTVLNADDRLLGKRIEKEKRRVITFGIENKADYRAGSIRLDERGYSHFRINNKVQVNLRVLGRHNIYNALVAFTLGKELGMDEDLVKQSLEDYKSTQLRMEFSSLAGINLINDAYNANPVSMMQALETLAQMRSPGRKIAVLGDMLELGKRSRQFHLEVGERVSELGIDRLLTRGSFSRALASGARQEGMDKSKIQIFKENKTISSWLLDNLKPGDTILFKASRRMGFEEIVEELKNLLEARN